MINDKNKVAILRLIKILRSRNSLLVKEIEGKQEIQKLPRNIREDIVDELLDEFTAKGVRPDGEPNEYGLEIESVIDACRLAWE